MTVLRLKNLTILVLILNNICDTVFQTCIPYYSSQYIFEKCSGNFSTNNSLLYPCNQSGYQLSDYETLINITGNSSLMDLLK
jgi:hypothetical protein